jgi:O-antigen/teichoic acid export membrane protein
MSRDVEELWGAARSAIVLSIGDILYNFFLFLGYVVIQRLLGREGYGLYSLVLSIPTITLSFISLSIDTAITRYLKFYIVKGSAKDVEKVVKASLYMKTLIGIGATAICFLFAEQLSVVLISRPDAYNYVKFISITAILYSLYTYFLSVFVGFEKVWMNTILKIIYSVSRLISVVPLLLLGFRVLGALASYILSLCISVIMGFVYWFSFMKKNVVSVGDGDRLLGYGYIVRNLVVYSLPLHISTTISTLLSMYQTMLLSRVLTDIEIGEYRAVLNLQTLLTVVTGPISLALLPMYTKVNAKGDREGLSEVFSMSNRYIALVMIPLTTVLITFSKEIIYIVYGSEYVSAYVYASLIFAPNLLAGFGSIAIPQLFNAVGETKLNLYTSLISTTVFIPVSYVLTIVLNYKLWGFLIASLIASVVGVIIQNIYVIKMFKKALDIKSVTPVYLSSVLATVPVMLIYELPLPRPISITRVVLGGIAYLLIYVSLCIVMKALDEHDLEFFEKAFSGIPFLNVFIEMLLIVARKIMKFVNSLRLSM